MAATTHPLTGNLTWIVDTPTPNALWPHTAGTIIAHGRAADSPLVPETIAGNALALRATPPVPPGDRRSVHASPFTQAHHPAPHTRKTLPDAAAHTIDMAPLGQRKPLVVALY